ncbi:unnamed protein product [Adineta ricciae]|uniref:F-box domain-containing protein n=1 Tax=Adineta ricciae TaxID=249248 RepID=A0A816FJV6_ADIRI|nr:unnamed protein product [Adineta ricciae]
MESVRWSQFEDLPDELLLLICSYLNQIEVLICFSSLNVRLTKAITEYTKRIDFNRIPLKLVNYFREEIFPKICSYVQSIILHDDLESRSIDLEIFPNLESIHSSNKFSSKYLRNTNQIQIDLVPADLQNELIEKLFSSNEYSNLRSLSFISYHGSTFSNIKLTNLNQIQQLTITLKNNVDLFELLHLLSSIVQKLHIHILYNGPFKSLTSSLLTLTKLRYFHLKTTFEDAIKFNQLEKLINDSMSLVEYLSIETLTRDENYINGYKWEKCFEKLHQLKTFVCSIRYRYKVNEEIDDQDFIEEKLFKSFSTKFWLYQRKWFIHFYSTVSLITNDNCFVNSFQRNAYRKIFLFTNPYPYKNMDITVDINKMKSTITNYNDISMIYDRKKIYSNVRHLYFDGEHIPIQVERFNELLHQFQFLTELKLDRLFIDSSLLSNKQIKLRNLNKLTIYHNNERHPLNINFLDLTSMHNLRHIRIPLASLPHRPQMPKQLETLILTECRDHHFAHTVKYENLRILKLHLDYFDRLLENMGASILHLIKTIYNANQTLESLQLMCPGVNQSKVKIFEKRFNSINNEYLTAHFDGKSLAIKRAEEFFCQSQL